MTQASGMSHGQVSSGKLKRILLRGVFLAGATFAVTTVSWIGPWVQTADAWWKCESQGYDLQLTLGVTT